MSKFYDFSELPALPYGWYYELHAIDPDVLHVVWPDHGAESVHFRLRIIESGWCIPYRKTDPRPVGRGWKSQLVLSAISRLQQNWT